MGSSQRVTAQGVRDLNHTGPRKKPEESSAAASAPTVAAPGTTDEAPSAPESIAANDHTADGSAVGNG
jgi:hypothetical protein